MRIIDLLARNNQSIHGNVKLRVKNVDGPTTCHDPDAFLNDSIKVMFQIKSTEAAAETNMERERTKKKRFVCFQLIATLFLLLYQFIKEWDGRLIHIHDDEVAPASYVKSRAVAPAIKFLTAFYYRAASSDCPFSYLKGRRRRSKNKNLSLILFFFCVCVFLRLDALIAISTWIYWFLILPPLSLSLLHTLRNVSGRLKVVSPNGSLSLSVIKFSDRVVIMTLWIEEENTTRDRLINKTNKKQRRDSTAVTID